jgi:hypothetical protein
MQVLFIVDSRKLYADFPVLTCGQVIEMAGRGYGFELVFAATGQVVGRWDQAVWLMPGSEFQTRWREEPYANAG